jgi:WD40 repeat protein
MKLEEKEGHSDSISAMIVVPKLHFVVTGGMDGKVLLWDVQTFKLKEVYK